MNLSSFVGLFLAIFFIIVSILLGGTLLTYFDSPSIMIVLGGTVSSGIITYSFKSLKFVVKRIKDAFLHPDINIKNDIDTIIDYANIARREGLLALDGKDFSDDFIKKGIELIVDGTDPSLVKDIMEAEISAFEEQEDQGPRVLKSMAQYAPAYGMIGTLIGLINMLKNMEDTSTIGPNMATALITTFYGVILANVIFLPLSNKMSDAARIRITRYNVLLEGILSIQNGENPRIIREKLYSLVTDKKLLEDKMESTETGTTTEQDQGSEAV